MLFWTQALKTFIALFIITDSIGNLPLFLGLTEGFSPAERRKAFNIAIFTGAILLIVFGFAGSAIFYLFDLTIDDMRIAGGILLFLISMELLFKGRLISEHKEEVGTVPMGCPLLVGPGAITTLLMLLRIYNAYAVILGTALCFFAIWLVLFFAENIFNFLGRNGSLIFTKIAAIIIAAIAVRFVRQGILAIFNI